MSKRQDVLRAFQAGHNSLQNPAAASHFITELDKTDSALLTAGRALGAVDMMDTAAVAHVLAAYASDMRATLARFESRVTHPGEVRQVLAEGYHGTREKVTAAVVGKSPETTKAALEIQKRIWEIHDHLDGILRSVENIGLGESPDLDRALDAYLDCVEQHLRLVRAMKERILAFQRPSSTI